MLPVNQCMTGPQIVVRAALERRHGRSPSPWSFPVGVLELVLDVEQPDADEAPAMMSIGSCTSRKVLHADQQGHAGDDDREGRGWSIRTLAHSFPQRGGSVHRQPVLEDELVERAEQQQDGDCGRAEGTGRPRVRAWYSGR